MRKTALAAALAALAFCACAKDPLPPARELIRNGDHAGAIALLEDARSKRPEDKAVRYQLFALYRYMMVQGPAAGQEAFAAKAVSEYDWICKSEGISPEYSAQEESLRKGPASNKRYEEARRPIYVH